MSPLGATATLVTMLKGPTACRTGDSPTLKPVSAGRSTSPRVISKVPSVVNLRTVWSKLSAQYNVVVAIDEDAVGAGEQPLAPGIEEFALLVEHDERMFSTVEHVDPVARTDGDTRHLDEGPALRQPFPPLDHLVGQSVLTDGHDEPAPPDVRTGVTLRPDLQGATNPDRRFGPGASAAATATPRGADGEPITPRRRRDRHGIATASPLTCRAFGHDSEYGRRA